MARLDPGLAQKAACPHPADRWEVTEPEPSRDGSPDLLGGVVCTDCGTDLGRIHDR